MAEDFTGEGQPNVRTNRERAEAARKRKAAQYEQALKDELRTYEVHGKDDRAAAVRAELERLGAEVPAPYEPPAPDDDEEEDEEPEDSEPAPRRTATTRGGRTKR